MESGTPPDQSTESGTSQDQEKGRVFDKWLVWVLAVLSIALPMLFFIVASSVDSASVDFTDLRKAAGRGEFLIPDAFLLIECSRRLIREVSPRRFVFKLMRALIIAICPVCATICLVASVILVVRATDKTAEAATWISVRFLLLGLVAGTISVWAKDGER
jgi:ABC-type Fe3+ transport system permease subunit